MIRLEKRSKYFIGFGVIIAVLIFFVFFACVGFWGVNRYFEKEFLKDFVKNNKKAEAHLKKIPDFCEEVDNIKEVTSDVDLGYNEADIARNQIEGREDKIKKARNELKKAKEDFLDMKKVKVGWTGPSGWQKKYINDRIENIKDTQKALDDFESKCEDIYPLLDTIDQLKELSNSWDVGKDQTYKSNEYLDINPDDSLTILNDIEKINGTYVRLEIDAQELNNKDSDLDLDDEIQMIGKFVEVSDKYVRIEELFIRVDENPYDNAAWDELDILIDENSSLEDECDDYLLGPNPFDDYSDWWDFKTDNCFNKSEKSIDRAAERKKKIDKYWDSKLKEEKNNQKKIF